MSRPTISYPTPVPGQAGRTQGQDAYSNPRQVSSSSTSSRSAPTIIDSSITRLLVLTKQMLQGMEQWSQGQISEEDVSDIYVKLGNGFEQCVDAFRKSGLSTKELDAIPNDLRICLEQALAEEPSQETLNVYLPNIRTIIFALLNGLKQKQVAYKRLLSDRQDQQQMQQQMQMQQQQQHANSGRALDPVEEANAKLTGRSVSPSGQQPQPGTHTLPRVPSSHMLSQRNVSGQPSRPAPPDAFRPSRMRAPEGPRDRRSSASSSHRDRDVTPVRESSRGSGTPPAASASAPASGSSGTPPTDGLVRHQLSDGPVAPAASSSTTTAPMPIPTILAPAQSVKPTPPRPDRFSRDSFGNPRPVSRFSVDSEITNGSPIRSPPQQTPPKARRISTLPEDDAEDAMNDAEPPAALSSSASSSKLAPSLPVLNLPSESISISDSTEPKTPPLPTDRLPDVPPETRSTLAALSRQDPLERRASRRFSSYNFSKMLPDSSSSKKLSSPQRPTRRVVVPAMPPLPESLTDAAGPPAISRRHLEASGSSDDTRPRPPRTPSPQLDPDSSMRIVPTPDSTPTPSAPTPLPASVSIFLQIGRQVKKTNVELPTSLSSIKLLFMERFEYDPGKEDFPEVYIRDHKTGVQFELEDMDDLREGIVLSLNIEPLDQVKQHFDLTVAALMQEIKEMKTSLDHTRRMSSMTPSPAAMLSLSPSMNMAAPMAKMTPKPEPLRLSPTISPSDSKASLTAVTTAPISGPKREELQAQHDEVTSLRRDLAIMRQVHVDFLAETKESFAKLRTQNSAMRDVVKTKMTGSRALLDNSKAKMETQCQEAIQAVEEISDIIDTAREDAYKRFVTPSARQVSSIKQSLEKATNFVDQFSRDVTLADPTWRSTWASELKRVQEEQGLLSHQRKLAADLRNDIKDASDMFSAVQDYVVQRASGTRVGSKGFRPPSPTEDTGGIPNLLMEIRTKEADPHQRLRAIEAQRKAREKENSERTDEFTSELGNFVKGRRLKKTGGHEEVERVRARRNDNTLKKMLTGDNPPNANGSGNGDLSASTTSTNGAPSSALTPQLTGVSMLSAQLTGTSIKSALSPQMTGTSSIMSPQFTGTGTASSGHRLSGSSVGGGGGVGSLGGEDSSSSVRQASED